MANLAYLIRPSALLRWINYNIFIIIYISYHDKLYNISYAFCLLRARVNI